MRIKVRGGTAAQHERPLCETCRWATIVRGLRQRDEIVECRQLSYENQRVPFPVASCTGYTNQNHPSIREMEEIAWHLRSDPRKQTGFVHASRLTDEERHELDEN